MRKCPTTQKGCSSAICDIDFCNKMKQCIPPRGRPPKPPGEVKTEVFTVRCTPTQKQQYEQLKTELNKQETTK